MHDQIVGLLGGYDRRGLLTFSNILKYFHSVKLFNVLHGTHNHFLDGTLSDQVNHSHNTRSQADVLLNSVYLRTSCSQQNFLYHAIIYWNQLPPHLRKLPDVVKFKKQVRIFFCLNNVTPNIPNVRCH